MGIYFSRFHDELFPHVSIRGGKTIPEIYNDLFYWTVPEGKRSDDCSGNKELYYSGPQVTRWTTGREELPSSILTQTANNPDVAVDTYAEVFHRLLYKSLGLSGNSIEMMDSDMKRFLNAFLITFFDVNGEPETKNMYYPASYALVTAIIYDRVKKDGSRGKERLIAPELYMPLQYTLSECRKKNLRFSSPFILDIMFREDYSLLRFSLDIVADGLGEKWSKKIQDNVKNGPHKSFIETTLGEHEIIFLAKLLALKEHYSNPFSHSSATSGTLCRALPFCQNSRTITELWSEIISHGINQALWNQIVIFSDSYFCQSTAPQVLAVTAREREQIMMHIQHKCPLDF